MFNLGDKGPGLLKEFFGDKEYDADIRELPYTFFDQDVSCVITEAGKIRSVFLVHRLENGNYRYEALRCDKKHSGTDIIDLLSHSYKVCVSIDDGNNMIFGKFDSEEGMEIIQKLFPDGRTLLKFKGVLLKPEPEQEISQEDWDELRKKAGLSYDKIHGDGLDDKSISEKDIKAVKEYIKKYSV